MRTSSNPFAGTLRMDTDRAIALVTAIAEEAGYAERPRFRPARQTRKRSLWEFKPFKLTMTAEIRESLAEALKENATKIIKNRVKWDVVRCPDFESFKARSSTDACEEVKILRKLLGTEQFNEYMNTFESDYNTARENHERKSSEPRAKPKRAIPIPTITSY